MRTFLGALKTVRSVAGTGEADACRWMAVAVYVNSTSKSCEVTPSTKYVVEGLPVLKNPRTP